MDKNENVMSYFIMKTEHVMYLWGKKSCFLPYTAHKDCSSWSIRNEFQVVPTAYEAKADTKSVRLSCHYFWNESYFHLTFAVVLTRM